MAQAQDFSKVMAANSDLELAEILLQPDSYVPEAIAAAQQELRTRNKTVEALLEERTRALTRELQKQKRSSSLNLRRATVIAVVSAVLGTSAAWALEFTIGKQSWNGFVAFQMEIGGGALGLGLIGLMINARMNKGWFEPVSNDAPLEHVRLAGQRKEALQSALLFSLAMLAAGILMMAIALPFLST